MEDGKGFLVCEGNTDKSAITLADDRFVSNFVVHISLVNVGERLVNIGMKVGEDFTVEWSDNKWILSDSKNRKLLISDKGLTKGMGCEWILALNRSVVSFWVDGCRIFCYVAEENIQGYWGLYSSATIKLSDFVIGSQPQTGILFLMGWERCVKDNHWKVTR